MGVILGVILAFNIDLIVTEIEALFDFNLMPADIYHLTKIPYMIKYIQKLKKKIAEKEKEMET